MAKKRKSLMDALSEYQEGNEFGRAQKKEEREKKMGQRAAKAKTNTKKAFSGKALLKTDSVKTNKKPTAKPTKKPTTTTTKKPTTTSSSGGTSKPKSTSGSGTSKPKSDNKTTTPSRVSKFLGGQTVKQVQDAAKKREEKKRNSPHGRQQAELDRLRKAQAEDRKKRTTKGRSSWAKGKLKGL